ncbi:MAG: T9SS type A sorting domain-containing protein [Flavobacteriales bacterium]|jgi:photosystem II stability/assembly factor-like uncharacterized protein
MKPTVLLLLMLSTVSSFGQNLKKPSAYEISTLPEWAKEMYGNQPNLLKVSALYQQYYKNHPFEKNYHTQYYKRWIRTYSTQINDDGEIIPEESTGKTKPVMEKSSSWSVVGPMTTYSQGGGQGGDQANIYSIDQCLAAPNAVICGTEPGEVYRSVDGGQNWSCISMGLDFSGGVTAVEISPTNPQLLFAGGNNGVYRSTNGGNTWTLVLPNSSFGVNEILLLPGNENLIFVASDKGLHRSTDGGTTWSQVWNEATYDIKPNVLNAQELYVVKHDVGLNLCTFLKSIDWGANWSLQSNGWYQSNDPARNDGGARIAVTGANPNRIYVYLIGESKANDHGFISIYRSDNAGATWINAYGQDGGPYSASHPNLAIGWDTWLYHQGFYNCAILANPNNADEILIGGLNLYRSTDGGASYTSVSGYVGGPLSLHVDNQDFRQVNGVTWITTDGGIYKSNDFLSTQPDFSMSGVHASDFWGFGTGWNEDVMVGGLYHNGNQGYHENYGSGNFLNLGGGEAPTGYVNPGRNRITYYSDIGGKTLPLSLTNPITGAPFGMAPNESYWAAESSEFEFQPNCYSIGYLGKDHKLWKTTNGGVSFNLVYTFGSVPEDQVKYIEVGSQNPQIIYLNQQPASGNVGKLWKSTDGGTTWVQLTLPAGNSRRMLLSLDPSNDQHVYLAFPSGSNGNKTFESMDGGQSFTNITSSALNNESVQSLLHVGGTNGGVYCATNKSLYYRNATMPWAMDNAGLPSRINGNILKPFYRDGKIRLASYGKGIWESAFNEAPSQPICRIMVDKLSQTVICASDSFYFEDHSILNHSNATWSWQFPTGTPSSSNVRNPSVNFLTGTHQAILTVTDGNGMSDSDTLSVTVNQYTLPGIIQEGFEANFLPSGWSIENEDNGGTWTSSNTVGGYGNTSKSAKFDNYNIDSQGSLDDLIFNIDANALTNQPLLTFDVAYCRWGGGYSDSLFIGVSTDCGASYQYVYYRGGENLATAPDNQSEFIPTANQWRTDTVDLSAWSGQSNVQVAFRNKGDWGNILYLDNINLGSTLGLETPNYAQVPKVYPNPACSGGQINVEPIPYCSLKLFDAKGKLKWQATGEHSYKGILPNDVNAGWYLLQIESDTTIWNYKLIVE